MRLPRSRRLTEGNEFRAVRESGESRVGRHLVIGFLEDPSEQGIRFGFITSRRVGKAVVRNRVRRQLRAIVREFGAGLPGDLGGKLVTIARYSASRASYAELAEDWQRALRRLAILPGEGQEER